MCRKYDRFGKYIQENKYFISQLNDIGIRKNYTGYYYLVDILDILINQDLKVKSFSRQVYPIIAEKYNTSECTVERNIRNLIDKSWSDKIRKKLIKVYDSPNKPHCRQFIYVIRNYIMMQIS